MPDLVIRGATVVDGPGHEPRRAALAIGQHWQSYLPYIAALLVGLLLIILFPQLSLFLPKSAGLIK